MKKNLNSKSIVFIHGLFQNPDCWIEWKKYFEKKGYNCYSPSYPFHEGNPSELRKNINPSLGRLTLKEVIESLQLFIGSLPEKPVLIGHSMGGLVVQKLISMNLGVEGVCIDSAPPSAILSLKWSFIKSTFPIVNPFKGNSVFLPDINWFHYSCCHTMTRKNTQSEYERFIVPESRNIPRSSLFKDGKIDFNKPHNPLLFIAGKKDHIIPWSLNRRNFNAYTDKESVKDFKVFKDRTHYICQQDNWEEVATYVYNWIQNK